MNRDVTATIEGNTLTLTNGNGKTASFEVKGKTQRKIDISSSGRTTFRYPFPNGVTVSVTQSGDVASIAVSKGGKSEYAGSLVSRKVSDDLIVALKKKGEEEQEQDPTALEGGKKKKRKTRKISRKKPAKLSRRRKFTHSK